MVTASLVVSSSVVTKVVPAVEGEILVLTVLSDVDCASVDVTSAVVDGWIDVTFVLSSIVVLTSSVGVATVDVDSNVVLSGVVTDGTCCL